MNSHLSTLRLPTNTKVNSIFFADANTIATTDKEGTVKLFTRSDEQEEATLTQQYKNHTGLITDLSFAPITHARYILTCGYDRTINLNLDGKTVFSYSETDTEVGYFTSCCFLRTEPNALTFLVGSSNGYVIEFRSITSFKPEKKKLMEGSIVNLNSSDGYSYVACFENATPKLCQYDQEPLELDTDLITNKLKLALPRTGEDDEVTVLLVDDLGNVEVVRVNKSERTVTREASLQLKDKLLNASWNFSGLSANLVADGGAYGTDFKLVRLQYDFEEKKGWSLIENDQVDS